jgi:gliding motility-associated-like protein
LNITEITGGTAPYDSTVYTSANPTTPYEEGFNKLVADSYIIVITDSLNCEGSSPFTITEPDSLILTIDTTLACSCGDICDGIIRYTPQGGTLNYQYLLTPGNIFGPAFNVVSGLCPDEYKLLLIDANGCRDSAVVEVLAPEPLELDIFLNAPTCTGMTDGEITFELSGGNGDLNLLVDPDTYELIEEDSVTFRLENVGEDTLYLEMFDENSCRILDTLGIVPDEITDIILSMSSTPETCWNERNGTATVAVQNGNPPYAFLWDDNENQTTATAMGLAPNSDYMVLVTDAIGCNLSSSVFVDGNKECFFISTGITPNGDGVNDTWVLGGFEYYPECKVNVFNRWGQNIFTSTGYSAPWDGRFNGQLLPVADYYFTIDYSEEKEAIMGTVTLKY